MESLQRHGLGPFLAALAVGALVFGWTFRSNRAPAQFGTEQRDYYNLLVDGFLDGNLSLKTEVPAALLNCPDPYDPTQRPPGIALHDVSYYRGKYYIYYGVVPAVLLLLPFRLVAGVDLPVAMAVLVFALGTYAVMLLLLASARRRFFPRVGAWAGFIVAAGAAFASCLPLLIRRGSMYELPIVSGAFFGLGAIGCLYQAALRPERRIRWLALASGAWALAIGSRPTYVFPAAIALGACLFVLWLRRDPQASRRERILETLAALLPAGGIGLLLAAYNFARFGNPAEFGLTYILSGVYEAKVQHFDLRYVAWNAIAYLFAPVAWGRYFPFVHELPIAAARPLQHFGMDHPFGVLANVSFLWLGVFAWARAPGENGPLRVLTAGLTLLGVGMAAVLLFFYAAMARYLGDFAPALATLAALGAFRLLDRCTCRRRRIVSHAAVAALTVLSSFTVLMFSAQLYGRFRADNPITYAVAARLLNAPVHWLEASRPPAGALVIRAVFSGPEASHDVQELVRTGFGEETDRVLVRFPDAGHVLLGYEHAGAPVVFSEPVALDRTIAHEVRITMGSLAPPLSWPGYRHWDRATLRALTRHLELALDGVPVLTRYQRFYDGGRVMIGGRDAPERWRGRIEQVAHEPLDTTRRRLPRLPERGPGLAPDRDGVWRLRVVFTNEAPGTRLPLIVSGETGRGDFLVVEHVDSGHLRFVFDHWGKRLLVSDPVSFAAGRDYQLEIEHPAYGDRDWSSPANPNQLVIRWDGRTVWAAATALYAFDRDDLYVGSNPIGGSTCEEQFRGRIAAEAKAKP